MFGSDLIYLHLFFFLILHKILSDVENVNLDKLLTKKKKIFHIFALERVF